MTREDLEHIIRASADLTDQYEFIIVGSQPILGPVPKQALGRTVRVRCRRRHLSVPCSV